MGRSNVTPPKDAGALAAMLEGQQAGPPTGKPVVKKVPTAVAPPAPLPVGKMGQACSTKLEGGKPCPGKLTDLSGHIHDNKNKRTLITLICRKCGKVQAQASIPDL